MSRSAKAIIAFLLICVGVLAFLLFQEKHENRNRWHDVHVNSQYGIVTSHEINLYADRLKAAVADTSFLFLFYEYESVREDQRRWNNSQLFNLAYVINETNNNHDSLLEIYRAYSSASSDIRMFFVMHKDANELQAGELELLIGYMRQLANATERFETFEFEE